MFQKKQTNECPSNAVKHLKSIACFHFLADFLVPTGFIFLAAEVENRLYGFAVHEVGPGPWTELG